MVLFYLLAHEEATFVCNAHLQPVGQYLRHRAAIHQLVAKRDRARWMEFGKIRVEHPQGENEGDPRWLCRVALCSGF